MPGLINESVSSMSSVSSVSGSQEGWVNIGAVEGADGLRIVDDDSYPPTCIPGYAEKPLSQQLEPIAVVGMGCRLPGDIQSPADFWKLMMEKGTGRTPKVPESRFNIDAYLHPNNERPGSFNVPGGYFLSSSLQEFDPTMFGISPIEAMWMDPQQRKLLEVVYEAFESGGITLEDVAGSTTACFVGSFTSDFQQMSFKEPDFRHSYAATGVDPGLISNRISHVFNLNGPSITVNTACSSSVYALHNACNALRNKECSAAVVGGTNLVLTVDQHMNTAKLGVLSPDSTCHTFDSSANGYGRADAVGAVYLKRLGDAIRDGDPIRGVIRSSAVNVNGKVPAVGITHPNLEGQERVIRNAYRRGGDLDPNLTGYFECHGTGTPIGDPLEVHAVAKAMNETRAPGEEPLMIGAVKTSIGHSEAASGLSALIKAVLAVEAGVIPPTRGVVTPNPKIHWDEWRVCVTNDPQPFPAQLPVRRISVNSFGYGGTNGHLIIEGVDSLVPGYSRQNAILPPRVRGNFNQSRPYLLPFSAHDKATLTRNIAAHGNIIDQYSLLDLSYTLGNRRSRLQSRGFVVSSPGTATADFTDVATKFAFGESKKVSNVGFAFTGQGSQWARMGHELLAYYPSFLNMIRRLDGVLGWLQDGPEWTLEDELLEPAETSRVNEAELSQPLCTAIQIAMVDLLRLWGIKPVVTVGHSSGEIAASYAAGLISASEAITAAYYRGQAVKDIKTNGAMMAVGLGAEAVQPYLTATDGNVTIACHNSPSSVTLSGDAGALELVKTELDKTGTFARLVKTGGKAYHSSHMQRASAPYEAMLAAARSRGIFGDAYPTGAVMVSSVTGSKLSADTKIDEHYWCANLVSPVLFNQAIQVIGTDPEFSNVDTMIEIGPHSALSGPIRQICTEFQLTKLAYVPSLVRGKNSASQLLSLAGSLFLGDYPIDMERITAIEHAQPSGKISLNKGHLLVNLPTYQWCYSKDLWAETRQSVEHRAPQHARHDLLGSRLPGGSNSAPIWRNILRIRDVPWLKHHSIGGEAVFPAAGYFAMAMEAMRQINERSAAPVPIDGYVLRDVSIKAALVTPDNDNGIEVLFSMHPSINNDKEKSWWDFNVSSCSTDGHWNNHMTGSININSRPRGQKPKAIPRLPQRASGKAWNQGLKTVGFDYGSTFADMDNIRFDGKNYESAATTVVKQEVGTMEGESRYVLHPSTVDSCLQLIIVSIYAGLLADLTCGAVPVQVDEVAIWHPTALQLQNPSAEAYSYTEQRGIRSFDSGTQLVASDGELLMDITNMRCVAYEAAVPQQAGESAISQPYMDVKWTPDIDQLKSGERSKELTVADLVNMAYQKNNEVKILDLGASHVDASFEVSSKLHYTACASTQEKVELLTSKLCGFANANAVQLDTTMNLAEQGVSEGSFDLVIASASTSVAKIPSLLSSRGHAIFPGTTELDASRFAKVELNNGLVLATAIDEDSAYVASDSKDTVTIVYRRTPASQVSLLRETAQRMGWGVQLASLNDCDLQPQGRVIMATDFEGPVLADIEEDEFASLRNIVTTAASILWVTCGALMQGKRPEHAMASGLARSTRSENASLDFVTLDVDLDSASDDACATEIIDCLGRQAAKDPANETEYCIQDGISYISRLSPVQNLNSIYREDQSSVDSVSFSPDMQIVGKAQGGKVTFERDTRITDLPAPGAVEIQALLTSLTREGVAVVNGTEYPTEFSHEIYGRITKLGEGVTNMAVGDCVVGFSFDKMATFQQTSAELVQKVEESDDPRQLLSLPMAYSSALYGLKTLASVQSGNTVLILSETGLVGAAASSVCKLLGATAIFATYSDEDAIMATTALGIPAERVIITSPMTSDGSFASQINDVTGGKGADVVFSCGSVPSAVSRECWRHIAPFGRFVDFGRKDMLSRGALDVVPLHRGASYSSFDILDLYRHKPAALSELLNLSVELYRKQQISTPSIAVRNIADLNAAIGDFSDHFAGDKILIEFTTAPGTTIDVLSEKPVATLKADATYLLVGCLGGLGRSLTSWMMSRGAKRFAFLSRSGADSEQAAALVQSIRAAGVHVQIIRGDAASKKDVCMAVDSIPKEYPVRGVVQAAMVLRDGLLHSMTYSDWQTSIRPKVHGTRNLHEALANTPLDFFISTSSTSGVLGTPGQANYAAGNAFIDSISRHRINSGQPACSLVLPMVLGVGVVAENPEIEEALKRKGIYGIDESHLLQSFEASILAQETKQNIDHIVVGFDPYKLQKSIFGGNTTDGFWLEDKRFQTIVQAIPSSSNSSSGSGDNIIGTIRSAASVEQAVEAVSDHFTDRLSRLLLIDRLEFDPDTIAIATYGLDSMISAELRNWIFKEYMLDIPFQQLLGPTLTITKFASLVCANLGVE